ncbi:efflux RND transporter periplasmic adaptor subunit [Priestia endophytica]|uniref:efflux RND transporter periplasmic adaptor subunit n=1 Tax=Priestia endophytica TaxID=135735 RepID=UPI00203BCAF9|nr:efflux RND transporter periplasmic adaptor subunit [Priestia endophytica]MCM3536527.1 efflux RND transporter periplasmic adaptor subunit [Priestia endophytica]
MRKLWLITSILTLAACAPKEITTDNNEKTAIPIQTAKVKEQDISGIMELSGVAMPAKQAPIVTSLPLPVEKVHVKVGDSVEKGDVLITLNNTKAQQQLNTASDTLSSIDSTLNETKNEDVGAEVQKLRKDLQTSIAASKSLLEGMEQGEKVQQEALAKGLEVVVTQAQLSQKILENQTATVPAETLNLQKQQAQTAVENTVLRAPFSGQVADIAAVEGSPLSPNSPAAVIVNQDTIKATFQLNSYEVAEIKPNMNATLSFEGIKENYRATVTSISPTANPETGLFPASISVQNENGAIKGGVRVSASVSVQEVHDALTVPVEALLYNKSKPYVYVANDDKAQRREIELGIKSNNAYEVKKGLKKGDLVIIEGKEDVKDTSDIEVIKGDVS